MPTLIKTTADGRKLEVIGPLLTLGGKPEAEELVEVSRHPNRQAIRAAAPEATHMAGRVTLTAQEAARAQAALAAGREAEAATPKAVAERFRVAAMRKACEDGIE